jgi:hypothetical protein
MSIYRINPSEDLIESISWDIDDEKLSSFEIINDYEEFLKDKKSSTKFLQELSSDDILSFFESLATHWLTDPKRIFLNLFSNIGVSFLISFIRRQNLEMLIKQSLHGDIHHLDRFIESIALQKKLMAHPHGVITHWLAGNVPVLGMISLIQGLVTKNTNVIKLPRENGLVLPLMLNEIAKYTYSDNGKSINGQAIVNSCLCVYCAREDHQGQRTLSVNSDVRVAWGGREAVESVMTLPRKYGTHDVIFGPKYSFAAIGKDSYPIESLNDLALKLALDASVFEQQGCNSPHTVFVEDGGSVSPMQFAEALANKMEIVINRIPKNPVTADQAYSIVNIRSEYSLTGRVFKSSGTEWTVIFSTDEGLADACYFRTIFVRPVKRLEDILSFIEPKKHQSLGLSIREEDLNEFAIEATKKGIERITELGKMSVYDYPWDGMFPINQFVRWVSTF